MTDIYNPVGAFVATSSQARPAYVGPSDKHVALAVDQLAEELELSGVITPRDQHYQDFIERIDERAKELARADYEGFKPAPTKFVGIAVDACGLLMEMQSIISRVNWFTSGAVELARLQEAAQRANPILAKLRSQQH